MPREEPTPRQTPLQRYAEKAYGDLKIKGSLTDREKAVFQLAACGLGNNQVGQELGISIYTVKTHVGNIIRKIDGQNKNRILLEYIHRALSQEGKDAHLQDMIEAMQIQRQGSTNKLTPREKEIAKLAVKGNANSEIAKMLVVDEKTVKAHKANIMRKFKIHMDSQGVQIPADKTEFLELVAHFVHHPSVRDQIGPLWMRQQ